MTPPNMQPGDALGNVASGYVQGTSSRSTGMPRTSPTTAGFDPETSVSFLRQLDPTGRHLLTAIHPASGMIVGRLFDPKSWSKITAWVNEHEAWNQYYHVNEPKASASGPKALKSEISSIRAIVSDKDPHGDGVEAVQASRAALLDQAARIACNRAAPSFVVDSGNGIQLIYRMAAKLPAAEHTVWAEAQGRGLKAKVDGDAVQNIDRIMRLPGTLNWPTAKKAAAGRKGGPVRILHQTNARFTPEALEDLWPPIAEDALPDGNRLATGEAAAVNALLAELDLNGAMAVGSEAEWPDGLAGRLEDAKRADPALRSILDGTEGAQPRDGGASERRAKLAAAMGRLGFEAQDYCYVLARWPLGEPTHAEELTERDVARGWARIGAPAAEKAAALAPEAWFETIAGDIDVSQFPQPAPSGPPETENIEWINPASWAGIEPPEQRWFVDGLVPHGEVTMVTGTGGIGKSLLALQLLSAVALGRPFLGRKTEAARVMGFFCEDSADVLHLRQKAICRALGCEVEALADTMRLSSRKHMDNLLTVFHRSSPEMRPTRIFEKLVADATAYGARLVVLDTIADTYAGDENNRSQVRQYVQACAGRLAAAIDGAVILLGHPSKSGESTGDGSSGSTGWHATVRSRLYLEATGKTGTGYRKLTSKKANYGPQGDTWLLEWRGGVLELVSSSETARGVSTTAADLDALILAGLRGAAADGMRVSMAANSTFRAWLILRNRDPKGFARFEDPEIKEALQGLLATGRVVQGSLGRGEDRHEMKSLVVAETELPGTGGVFD